MKKAKEYAREFVATLVEGPVPVTDERLDEAVKVVWDGLVKEVGELLKVRKPTTELGVKAIFEEQARKWAAVARRVNAELDTEVLREVGFLPVLYRVLPPRADWAWRDDGR